MVRQQSLFEVVLPLLSFYFQYTLSPGDSTLGSWNIFYFCYLVTKFPNIFFSIPDDDWKLDCCDHLVVSLSSRFSTQQWWEIFHPAMASLGRVCFEDSGQGYKRQGFNWEWKRVLITPSSTDGWRARAAQGSVLPIPVAAVLCCSLMWQKHSGSFSS